MEGLPQTFVDFAKVLYVEYPADIPNTWPSFGELWDEYWATTQGSFQNSREAQVKAAVQRPSLGNFWDRISRSLRLSLDAQVPQFAARILGIQPPPLHQGLQQACLRALQGHGAATDDTTPPHGAHPTATYDPRRFTTFPTPPNFYANHSHPPPPATEIPSTKKVMATRQHHHSNVPKVQTTSTSTHTSSGAHSRP